MYRKMTTGFYVPTETFKSIPEHIAVMYEDDQTLVAVCGPADDEHVAETTRQARLFAASFELLEACELAMKVYGNITSADFELGKDKPAREALAAAIAKARGEQ